jgi:hypothetical protein
MTDSFIARSGKALLIISASVYDIDIMSSEHEVLAFFTAMSSLGVVEQVVTLNVTGTLQGTFLLCVLDGISPMILLEHLELNTWLPKKVEPIGTEEPPFIHSIAPRSRTLKVHGHDNHSRQQRCLAPVTEWPLSTSP